MVPCSIYLLAMSIQVYVRAGHTVAICSIQLIYSIQRTVHTRFLNKDKDFRILHADIETHQCQAHNMTSSRQFQSNQQVQAGKVVAIRMQNTHRISLFFFFIGRKMRLDKPQSLLRRSPALVSVLELSWENR